jgi:hypothetical protein
MCLYPSADGPPLTRITLPCSNRGPRQRERLRARWRACASCELQWPTHRPSAWCWRPTDTCWTLGRAWGAPRVALRPRRQRWCWTQPRVCRIRGCVLSAAADRAC